MTPLPRLPCTAPDKQQTYTIVKAALEFHLPADVSRIISDYVYENIDIRLAMQPLTFNLSGAVSNPEVRAAHKNILTSRFVPPLVKAQVFMTMHASCLHLSSAEAALYQREMEKIGEEIQAAGDRMELANIELNNVTLTLNLSHANLQGATFRQSNFNCDLSASNLTDTLFVLCGFAGAKIKFTSLTNLSMIDCMFRETEVTGTTLTDKTLLKHLISQTTESQNGVNETRYFLDSRYEYGEQATIVRQKSELTCSIM